MTRVFPYVSHNPDINTSLQRCPHTIVSTSRVFPSPRWGIGTSLGNIIYATDMREHSQDGEEQSYYMTLVQAIP